jgi:dolichol-phosphate mannosyltransferase
MISEKKAVIVIPTYNEKYNIQELLPRILQSKTAEHLLILVVDDDSPDGTGDAVASLAQEEKRIHLLIRKGKRGRGNAGIEGFKKALTFHPHYILEMDADLSHRPEEIPRLLEAIKDYDVVIGSRFVPGGQDAERNIMRKLITSLARRFLRLYLKIPVEDVSSGFRCFRREVLEKIDLESLESRGPSLVQEILYRVFLLGYRIKEVPITFCERKRGETKLTPSLLLETLLFNWKLKKGARASLSKKGRGC